MAKTVDNKKIIYTMDDVSRAYGTKVVLKNIGISYYYGAKIGVIGPNGSGKSSLFKILAGRDTEFTGETHLAPGYSIGYLEQEPELEAGKTVREIVGEGVKEITDLLAEFDTVNEAFGDPDADFDKLGARQAELQEKLDALDAWNLDANLELAMEALRCPPGDQIVDVLSGGERSRLAMIRLLLEPVNLLILDEPTNHLDMRSKDVLKEALREFDGTLIVVSHDREFLDGLVDKVYEFGNKRVREHLGGIYEFLERRKIETLQELERKAQTVSVPAATTAQPESVSAGMPDAKPQAARSYEEQKERARRLRKLEKAVAEAEQEIMTLEDEIATLEARMATPEGAAEPTLYTEHGQLKTVLSEAMDRWTEASEALSEASAS